MKDVPLHPLSQPLNLNQVSSQACGKAILVGEHAVVYGAAAIALPLPSRGLKISAQIKATGSTRAEKSVLIKGSNGAKVPKQVEAVFEDAFRLLHFYPEELILQMEANLPMGAGLGGSASLCVAVLKILASAKGEVLSLKELARLANELEKRFHGNPSGLDTAVISYNSPIYFSKGTGGQPLTLASAHSSFHFLCLDSGTRSATKSMIETAKPYFTCSLEGEARINAFDLISQRARQAIETGDTDGLAVLMNEAHQRLNEAGVSSSELNRLAQLCLEAGALAAKPTGAGGGGCLLVLLASENAPTVSQKIKEALGPKQELFSFVLGTKL